MRRKMIVLATLFVVASYPDLSAQSKVGKFIKGLGTSQQSNVQPEAQKEAPKEAPKGVSVTTSTVALVPHLTPNTKTVRINDYNAAFRFHDGLLYIQDNNKNKQGFLDVDGNLKIDYKWDLNFIGDPKFNNGYCVVHLKEPKGKRFYIIDHDGNQTALPVTYTYVTDICEGRAIAISHVAGKSSFFYIDHTGKKIFTPLTRSPKYAPADPEAPRPYKDGLAPFYDVAAEKWGFHDNTGKLVIAALYAKVDDFNDGMAAVKLITPDDPHGKWGFVDVTGQMVIQPKFSYQPSYFSEDLAAVKKQNDKWCFISKSGEVSGGEYDKLTPFYQGHAFAIVKSDYVVLDKQFNVVRKVASFPFPSQRGYYAVGFYNQLAAVGSNEVDDKIGGRIINPQGETVITDKGTNARICNFSNGLAFCKARLGQTYYDGFINSQGEYVFIFQKEEF